MVYLAIATDYDGTLAQDGQVGAATLAALRRWRNKGRKLILITGRQFDDLLQVCPCLDLFDWVVVENGAMLYQPASKVERLLTDRPAQEFVQRLSDRIQKAIQSTATSSFAKLQSNIAPVAAGRVIVTTWEPHSVEAIALIQEMGLDLQVILNKGAVMILPNGIDKATGLVAAANELGIGLEAIVGIGDAENDLVFLKICGYSVAVANALPVVKEQVDHVTTHSRGAGVVELIEAIG
ncbi:HAD family hydrolase [Leptothermofonsia sp. ETS-13]|uniref:HAD family hydrolase n=1 Tax=Leptothermofonsia sp. ETS-13 TaxID=3035696 RepID=UPI003B9DEE4F